ncbi:acyltransferase family protein [Sphingomonas sp. R86520]|uniref:acyltransferase family protein n=1 Tax=Sphingomonas sp. R86520 TaxID=3093859 RepID=UPI0036D3E1A6
MEIRIPLARPILRIPRPGVTLPHAAERRTTWLDAARGAGAVLVVIGHVERGLSGSGLAIGDDFQRFDLALYTFHMPFFFLLAGANSGRSINKSWLTVIRRKIVTIIYPYILWSLIQGTAVAIMAHTATGTHHWRDLILILWRPIGQFWFLYALFVYTIIAAFFRHNYVIIITIGAFAVVAADFVYSGSPLDLGLHHMIFFAIGIVLSERIIAWHPARPTVVAAVATAAWALGWQLVPHTQRFAYLTVGALPCAFAGSVCVMAAVQSLSGMALSLLAWLGQRAMAIFVLHILAASGVRIALVIGDIPLTAGEHMLIGTACGLALPCAFQEIAERLGIARLLALRA